MADPTIVPASAITSVVPPPKFVQINMISDGSVPAANTDPNLINPWGISFGPTTNFWISDQVSSVSSVDSVIGAQVTLNVIPTVAAPTPTGQVFNPFPNAFKLATNGESAVFLFASTAGSISGWTPDLGQNSFVAAASAGAAYTGLAIANSATGPTLYAANAKGGTVDMYDANFSLTKKITDPTIPAGFSPYNAQVLDGSLYVTYSKADRTTGEGFGFVDKFDLNGNLLGRVASAGTLNDPWGLAIAPSSFGTLAGDLLVGNFGDGRINVYDSKSSTFLGQLMGTDNQPIAIQDLWAITPGNGTSAGATDTLYFTAGLTDEKHGLFGSLSAAPPADVVKPPMLTPTPV